LGIGDWAQSPIPNPQSPIPNPQSPIPIAQKGKFYFILGNKLFYIFLNKHKLNEKANFL